MERNDIWRWETMDLKKISISDGYPISCVYPRSREPPAGANCAYPARPCPKAVVAAPDGLKAYVNYQCSDRPGHDPVIVYDVQTDLPAQDYCWHGKRWGPLAIAPKGRRALWAAGNNACAEPNYAEGKEIAEGWPPPITPEEKNHYTGRGIVNIIDTDEDKAIATVPFLGYDLNNPAKPIGAYFPTFSPDGEKVAVTTGSGILIFASGDPQSRHPVTTPVIARANNLAFASNGQRAYAAIPDKDLVEEIQIDPKEVIPIYVTSPWIYVVAGFAGLFGMAPLLSPAIGRGIRVAFGQRLTLVSEISDYDVVIRSNDFGTQLSIRDRQVSDYPRPEQDRTTSGSTYCLIGRWFSIIG
jgi:hypothetical protein